jgi:glutaminyl-tRNA synthetase
MGLLENCIREDLDRDAPRRMAVLRPLKAVITNYPEGKVEEIVAPNHPKDEAMGSRTVVFEREVYIDREDFREEAPSSYKRLMAGGEVRLRNAYVIRCDEVVRDERGELAELRCSYDPATLGHNPEGRKVRGVIHWAPASRAIRAEIRLYDRLFTVPSPDADKDHDFKEFLNPESGAVLQGCLLEPSLAGADRDARFQFEREGYFWQDSRDSTPERPVYNRIVTLRDSWAKIESKGAQGAPGAS